ncbi:uncharacterized protein [Temnothorax nylanderi]|uniref:uncharacterized protein isoform X1 n=1 Tax=Temnothorax nylanderi TaxID=102681 RepID=UPI003A8A296B
MSVISIMYYMCTCFCECFAIRNKLNKKISIIYNNMVAYCFVEGCTSSKYKRRTERHKSIVPMYGFPTDKKLKEKWINALLVLNKQSNACNPLKYSRICIKHFSEDQIEQFGLQSVRLKKNAVPSVFPNAEQSKTISENEDNLNPNEIEEIDQFQINQLIIQDKNSVKYNEASEINLNELQENIEKETPISSHHCSEETDVFSSNMQVEECIEDKSVATFTKKIRYPGEITDALIENMSRDEMINVIKMLRETTRKKNITIKRLRTQLSRKEKKTNSLSTLLEDLKQKYSLSSDCCGTLQVNKN